MKSLLVVGCLCLVAATVRAEPEEIEKFMELAKEHAESCAKELGVSGDDWAKPESEDIKTTGCMHACIMKQLGMMESTEGVAFNLDKIKEVVDKISPNSDAAEHQMKITKECIETVAGKTEACEVALELSKCYNMKHHPE